MPTFGSWEATVLDRAYEHVDYISAHVYYDPSDGDRGSLLASGVHMDEFISSVVATADHVAAKLRQTRRLKISFDEWNVWYESRLKADLDRRGWVEAPALIEDTYNAVDAVVVGDLLITLLRHADRVGVACQAQLANVIAPIRTRNRRACLAADDLPPLRAHGPVCPRHGAADRTGLRWYATASTATCPSSTPLRYTTRRSASWSCSRSTGLPTPCRSNWTSEACPPWSGSPTCASLPAKSRGRRMPRRRPTR